MTTSPLDPSSPAVAGNVVPAESLRVLAHDLKGPLGVIRGFVEVLRDYGDRIDDRERAHILQRIDGTAEDLLHLVSDVSDALRPEPPVIARQTIRTDERIRDAVAAIDAEGHEIDVEAAEGEASVDPGAFDRILRHLLRNALHHTPAGTSIRVSTTPSPDGVTLVVEDRGPGVADEEKARIFEPFVRGANGTRSTVVGTGIGLAVVARLAEAHGGRAWVEDRSGGGASFRVVLARA